MKTIKWMGISLALAAAVLCAGCGNDDDNNGTQEPDETETVVTDYTATQNVKTVPLPTNDCVIYEDFNKKYILNLAYGKLLLVPYYREDGKWENVSSDEWGDEDIGYYVADMVMKDVGEVNDLADITEKISPEYSSAARIFPDIQPHHGYAVAFKTGSGEVKYMRVFVSSYTLDDEGSLSTVTVKYQLY